MLPLLSEKFPPLPLDELCDLIAAFPAATLTGKEAIIGRLVASHVILNLNWGAGHRYRRARTLEEGETPNHVDELIWLKGVPARVGRANPAGFPVLYLSGDRETAFREARAENHPVLLAEFEFLSGRSTRVMPVGELFHLQRTGRGRLLGDASPGVLSHLNSCPMNQARAIVITDAFLFNCLFEPVDQYDVSSLVAAAMFRKMPGVSALVFPSRQQIGGINFAVRVEHFWRSWGLRAVRRGRAVHLAQGYYRFLDTHSVTGITHGGKLVWNPDPEREDVAAALDPLWTPQLTTEPNEVLGSGQHPLQGVTDS